MIGVEFLYETEGPSRRTIKVNVGPFWLWTMLAVAVTSVAYTIYRNWN